MKRALVLGASALIILALNQNTVSEVNLQKLKSPADFLIFQSSYCFIILHAFSCSCYFVCVCVCPSMCKQCIPEFAHQNKRTELKVLYLQEIIDYIDFWLATFLGYNDRNVAENWGLKYRPYSSPKNQFLLQMDLSQVLSKPIIVIQTSENVTKLIGALLRYRTPYYLLLPTWKQIRLSAPYPHITDLE